MVTVNLIPAKIREARHRRIVKRRWVGLGIVYGLLAVAACVVCQKSWEPPPSSSPELTRLRGRLAEVDRTITRIKPELEKTKSILDSYQVIMNNPDWSTLLAALSNQLDQRIVLRRCRLENNGSGLENRGQAPGQPIHDDQAVPKPPSGFTLKLAGLGQSQGDVARFVLQLEKIGLFDHVKLVRTQQETFLSSEVVAFHIACLMKASS